jgi:hypothetical protein
MLRWVHALLPVCEGTGHGVGAFLNVHEGPHGISSTIRKGPMMEIGLVPGMVVSNEPGYATRHYASMLPSFIHACTYRCPRYHTRDVPACSSVLQCCILLMAVINIIFSPSRLSPRMLQVL